MDKALSLPQKYGYRLMYTFLLTAVFLLCTAKYTGIGTVGGMHIASAIFTIIFFTGFSLFKTKGRIICGLFAVMPVLCFIIAFTPGTTVTFLQSYFKWLTNSGIWLTE